MTATDLERKVRQHDNDISAVYTMIADIQNTQRRHTNRFDELTEDVGSLDGRLTSVEGKVGSLEGKVGSLEDKVGSLEGKVGSLEDKIGSLEGKVGTLEDKIDQVLDLLRR